MICEVLTNRFAVYSLISIIEMFFSNLPMFFRFSKRTKGQKDTYDCYLFILV